MTTRQTIKSTTYYVSVELQDGHIERKLTKITVPISAERKLDKGNDFALIEYLEKQVNKRLLKKGFINCRSINIIDEVINTL